MHRSLVSPARAGAVLAALACLLALPSAAPAQSTAETPPQRALYDNGPSARYLLGGTWLFRLDPTGVGLGQRFQRQTSTEGWAQTTAPNVWNATDESVASMTGTVGWYRKDFRLPSRSSRFSWVLRFESVNYRMRAWINGKPIGSHTGAYLPFELRIPPSYLKRSGVNRLVLRVDNRRHGGDFPPSGLSVTGEPTGGWWNYGGIQREVYLRRIDRIDFSTVQVRPILSCSTCDARVEYRVTVRNYDDRSHRVRLRSRFGSRAVDLGTRTVGPKDFATFRKRITVRNPRLWSPSSPTLYNASMRARIGDRTVARYTLRTGVRSIRVDGNGRLRLNGKRLNFRGVGLHEDDRKLGFAINNDIRKQIIKDTKELGATLIRSHYPFHPYLHELADREGILVWSEIPVYALKTEFLAKKKVRELAREELAENIRANQNHPSVIVWSVGNELSARPGPVQGSYLKNAAEEARELDPTRPVGYAVAGYPAAGCQERYDPLDIIGINEYFGWYPGPNGQIADPTLLSAYLDDVRACYPKKAVVVSEFGAEANRSGPIEEKGTFEYQQTFVNYHLGVHASKPWLSGSVYWALKEFRVRPGWDGGNPRPNPPIHEKGLITFDGVRKPAFFDVQRIFKNTRQIESSRR